MVRRAAFPPKIPKRRFSGSGSYNDCKFVTPEYHVFEIGSVHLEAFRRPEYARVPVES